MCENRNVCMRKKNVSVCENINVCMQKENVSM